MSPRAAWRLESLGFTQVFDYVTGKQDWFASGLPRAGKQAERSGAGDVAQYDVTHCSTRDRVGEVRQRAEATGQRVAVVLNEAAIVLGLLCRHEAEKCLSPPA